MHFIIVSIFPEMFLSFMNYGLLSRACKKGAIKITTINPRKFIKKGYQSIDDRPFGGGAGMIMKYSPLEKSILEAKKILKPSTMVIHLSPKGSCIKQDYIKRLCNRSEFILLCGRYKGIDERLIEDYVDEEISIGDYVLSGGELPAMVLIDSIVRLLPNVVHNSDSVKGDSFYNGLLDHPHYTRPAILKNRSSVPKVLLSGNHKAIDEWKHRQRLQQTFKKRQDLINWKKLSITDQEFIQQLTIDTHKS